MPNFRVVYSPALVSDPYQGSPAGFQSPSPGKPLVMAKALLDAYPDLLFEAPKALVPEDFYRAHAQHYVDGVLAGWVPNGFGTTSKSLIDSLPYTCGAMYDACRLALSGKPCSALVSGFHHAGWASAMGFCTFNGLLIAAFKLIAEGWVKKVAIIDCDYHYGNGTDEILEKLGSPASIFHCTMGAAFIKPQDAGAYLGFLKIHLPPAVSQFNPDLIIYQSGADVHVDDPLGGVLTEQEMIERDEAVFEMAHEQRVPIAWNLAGGYQLDPEGGLAIIKRLHMNTFDVVDKIYRGANG